MFLQDYEDFKATVDHEETKLFEVPPDRVPEPVPQVNKAQVEDDSSAVSTIIGKAIESILKEAHAHGPFVVFLHLTLPRPTVSYQTGRIGLLSSPSLVFLLFLLSVRHILTCLC